MATKKQEIDVAGNVASFLGGQDPRMSNSSNKGASNLSAYDAAVIRANNDAASAAPAPAQDATATVDRAAIAAAQAAAAAKAKLNAIKGQIAGRRGSINDIYNAMFGDLDTVARERASDIERKSGENIGKLTDQYTASIPGIESSYAALGAGDSTDTRDAKIKAKSGYDDSVKQVGEQKQDDLAKVGSYVNENKAKFGADHDSILRLIDQAGQSDNEGDVRNADNEVANRLGQANVTRATLGTDAGARGALSGITADNGRFDSIAGALDNIMQSSLAGGVKAAAVEAASNAAGLTDEDKAKIKMQYGNVYDAPTV